MTIIDDDAPAVTIADAVGDGGTPLAFTVAVLVYGPQPAGWHEVRFDAADLPN